MTGIHEIRFETARPANYRRFNQVDPIDRTYKGSRPPIVSICFTCGFQMFNPVAGYMLRVYIYYIGM